MQSHFETGLHEKKLFAYRKYELGVIEEETGKKNELLKKGTITIEPSKIYDSQPIIKNKKERQQFIRHEEI